MNTNTTITMTTHAENYLSERRRLGFGLCSPGYSIISFAHYIDALNTQEAPTVEMMADWARQDQEHSDDPATWARRLKHLRSFCRYLQQFDPRTEVPDDNIFGRVGQRLAPHIYSEQEIIDLLAAAHNLNSFIPGLRGATGIPMKRFERPMLGFLSREEMLAILDQPGETWTSQRDHLLLTMLYNTGARVSEIIGVKVGDVVMSESACVHLRGKGRKQRSTPLWKSTVQEIRTWLKHNPTLSLDSALLPNRDGQAMSRFNVTQRLNLAVAHAAQTMSSLSKRKISPHTIRHTTAMHLLQSGVAFNVIALWLGHESTTTTHRYVEADLTMKNQALARLKSPETKSCRYHPDDDALMQFLQAL